ncbi:MAG: hypothetical protein ACR2OJ_13355 [Hyphomicrobiales bacterium]
MFSNVNEVVEQLRLAEIGGYQFAIDWSNSPYRDVHRKEDPWEYFFEPCFPEAEIPKKKSRAATLPGGKRVACTRENIITPRLDDGKCAPLLLPRDRLNANRIIRNYLHLKPHVLSQINLFYNENLRNKMIGLHVRGPGRIDGGVDELRARFGFSSCEVPLEPYFKQVDEALRILPDGGIFACSDSNKVIEEIQIRFGDKVIVYPAQRSDFGEMHTNHAQNRGLIFDPYELGLDVLCEAYLLAKTDIFVHGNSNVANFVICENSTLVHAYIQA